MTICHTESAAQAPYAAAQAPYSVAQATQSAPQTPKSAHNLIQKFFEYGNAEQRRIGVQRYRLHGHGYLLNPKNNIAAARAVDWEFNYNFGSNLGRFGSGRGSNRRSAPVGFICADFQLERSHGDTFRDQNRVFVQPVPTRELQGARKSPL